MRNFRVAVEAAFIVALTSSAALSQDSEDFLTCKEIKNDVGRLNCYDAQAAKANETKPDDIEATAPSSDLPADTGKWVVESGVDAITDEITFLAALEAEQGATKFSKPMLFIRCKQQTSEVFIGWSDYLSENTLVTIRFGSDKPQTFRWDPSTDQTATFLQGSRHAWFFETAMNVDQIAAQIEPYQSGPVTATFDVKAMSEVFADKAQLCGFSKE